MRSRAVLVVCHELTETYREFFLGGLLIADSSDFEWKHYHPDFNYVCTAPTPEIVNFWLNKRVANFFVFCPADVARTLDVARFETVCVLPGSEAPDAGPYQTSAPGFRVRTQKTDRFYNVHEFLEYIESRPLNESAFPPTANVSLGPIGTAAYTEVVSGQLQMFPVELVKDTLWQACSPQHGLLVIQAIPGFYGDVLRFVCKRGIQPVEFKLLGKRRFERDPSETVTQFASDL